MIIKIIILILMLIITESLYIHNNVRVIKGKKRSYLITVIIFMIFVFALFFYGIE